MEKVNIKYWLNGKQIPFSTYTRLISSVDCHYKDGNMYCTLNIKNNSEEKPHFLDEIMEWNQNNTGTVDLSRLESSPISFHEQKYNRIKKIIIESLNKKGQKNNEGKLPMSRLFDQFPDALQAIMKCSVFGHEKYKEVDKDWKNYKRVEGGSKSYADAGFRHRMQEGNDDESNLPHQYHTAWNALAELQLWIEENK